MGRQERRGVAYVRSVHEDLMGGVDIHEVV